MTLNNDKTIANLKALIELLESRPKMPKVEVRSTFWMWNLEELKSVARQIGSCKKRYTNDNFELVVPYGDGGELIWYCDRSKVCKKVITYDCEDAEKILLDLEGVAK